MSSATAMAPPERRRIFARQAHAETHAIVALREVRRMSTQLRTRHELERFIEGEIARRCGSLGLDPDLLFDEIETIEDSTQKGEGA
jgi:hypothetical protein